MSNQLEINLQYLALNEKHTYKKIMQFLDSRKASQFEVHINENNFTNLIYTTQEGNRYFIYDENEAQRKAWMNEHTVLQHGFHEVVMYGFGLSYHLVDLIQLNPHLQFYIYEPRVDIFIEALKVMNIEDVLKHPQVKMLWIGNDENDVVSFLYYRNTKSLFRYYNICIPFYLNIDEEGVKSYYDHDYKSTRGDLLSLGFYGVFGRQPYINAIRNLSYVNKFPSLKVVEKQFKGCTALIVGAGPSLESDIALIKQYKESVFIIAAGSAIQSLLHHGITPHLIVTIDPGQPNGNVFSNIDYANIPVAFSLQVYHPILEQKSTGLFHFALDTEKLANTLLNYDIEPNFYTTPSVSGVAIQVAQYLGATKIVLVGQDLSFPNNQFYASGAKHINVEKLEKVVSKSEMTVLNVNGGYNATNISMTMAREGIEEVIKRVKSEEVQVVNASSKGAVIEGAPFIPLTNIVEELNKNEVYRFNELIQNGSSVIEPDQYGMHEAIKKQIDQIIILEKCCKDIIKIVSDYEVASRKSFNAANKKLLQLESTFSKITSDKFYQQFVTSWSVVHTREYDANVLLIDAEPNMIKKGKLLQDILIPYVKLIQTILGISKDEFQTLLLNKL